MAELADALDLGSSEATRTGSIPASRTNIMKIPLFSGYNRMQERGFVLESYLPNLYK